MKEESPYREDWTRDIHDRLAEFETDAPEGLWDAISSSLETSAAADADRDADTVGRTGTRTDSNTDTPDAEQHRIIPLTLRRAVAVAAAIAVILTSAVLIIGNNDPTESFRQAATAPERAIAEVSMQDKRQNSGNNSITDPKTGTTTPAAPTTTGTEDLVAAIIPSTTNKESVIEDKTPAHEVTPAPAEENTPKDDTSRNSTPKDGTAIPTDSNTDRNSGSENATISPRSDSERLADARSDTRSDAKQQRKARSREARGIQVGAYASGGTASYAARGHANGVAASVMAVNSTNWEDSPLLGILLYNRDKETETRVRHHQPIRAGVSFTYMINRRFGIESGLTYTLLASDMHDGSETHFYDGRQRLHYMGIPLNVKYNIADWRRFGVYGSAGLLAEQCIAGRIRKEYVLNGTTSRTSVESIGTKPFQLSANISAGVRYNFTPTVGIYVEPGLSYYFDDGSSLETVYKERPLNFNLNVGIRFTFGR